MRAVNCQQKQHDHVDHPFLVHKNEQRDNVLRNPRIWKSKRGNEIRERKKKKQMLV